MSDRIINKRCVILGAGKISRRPELYPGDFVIAADAGYLYAKQNDILPDLTVGDFDSLGSVPEGENVLLFPTMKDDTDMMLAVKQGVERGCGVFHLYGGMGGRTDHTLANIQILAYLAAEGRQGWLHGENELVTAVKSASVSFEAGKRGYVSVFAHGGAAEGVWLRGLKYTLENAVLSPDFPLGVSNEFCGQGAEISVENGTLVIILSEI